jgi:F0F1-type ATP synthase membrane subunit c/vacuolar-type H+-ATPase subunit K
MEEIFRKIPLIFILSIFLMPSFVTAQVGGYGITSTYEVSGQNVISGDLVSFNKSLNIYEATKIEGDENMFGVIDTDPVVVFRRGVNNLPVVQLGEVFVNVTNINGAISIGDSLTSSSIEGKAQKLSDKNSYVLGTALQSFDGNSGTTTVFYDGNELVVGQIKVLLSIGPYLDSSIDEITPATIFVRESGEQETGLETIFRYITAALFALGTVFVVLKTFGPNVGKGVVSIGRNPLAKRSIQAMVVFNIILILAISIVSFIVSLLIIFLPI